MIQANKSAHQPIGVFDSGYGGLTVLKEIVKELPQYDYLYLGDNARAPMESTMSLPPLAASGRLFAAAAFLEGLTWAGLLVGMWLKYGMQATDTGVWLFGRLHGAAFLFYLVVSVIAGVRLRWPGWALLLALLAAVPPLVTVPLEMWYRRKGLLSDPATR